MEDAFTAREKATKHMVCMCMGVWVEELVCICDTYVCACLRVAACVGECIRACVCLSGCVYNMTGVWSLSPESEMVYSVYTHTHTHTEASCVVRLFTVSLFTFHIRAQGLWLESVSGETCPVHRKTTVFFLPLSLITFLPL